MWNLDRGFTALIWMLPNKLSVRADPGRGLWYQPWVVHGITKLKQVLNILNSMMRWLETCSNFLRAANAAMGFQLFAKPKPRENASVASAAAEKAEAPKAKPRSPSHILRIQTGKWAGNHQVEILRDAAAASVRFVGDQSHFSFIFFSLD